MEAEKKKVGVVTHFYGKINVAIVDLQDTLNAGDMIEISGPTTNLQMTADSIQIEHENVKSAKKGQSIGLQVPEKVKENDVVYRIVQ
jgi:U32 family peptidase